MRELPPPSRIEWRTKTMNNMNCTPLSWLDAAFGTRLTRALFQRETKTNRDRQLAPASLQAPAAQRVRVEFVHPRARKVNIAGSFNDWRPESSWMIAVGNRKWVKDLMLPPGRYEYCFVVDRPKPGPVSDPETWNIPAAERVQILWVPEPTNDKAHSLHPASESLDDPVAESSAPFGRAKALT